MEGFHYTDAGANVTKFGQVFAQVNLPPGKYIVFASATIVATTKTPGVLDRQGVSYEARLELSSIQGATGLTGKFTDSVFGALKDDGSDLGSRSETISLNIAGEVTSSDRARLVVSLGDDIDTVRVVEPRLSAIRVDTLSIISGDIPPDTITDRVRATRLTPDPFARP